VIGASRVRIRAEHQRCPVAIGRDEGHTQSTLACHPPNDLQFLTDSWWHMTGSQRETPDGRVGTRPAYLVGSASLAEWSGGRTSVGICSRFDSRRWGGAVAGRRRARGDSDNQSSHDRESMRETHTRRLPDSPRQSEPIGRSGTRSVGVVV